MILLFTDVSHTPGIGKYAGTYKVATELRKNKFDTQVIDCFKYLGIKRLKKILDKFLTNKIILPIPSVFFFRIWENTLQKV